MTYKPSATDKPSPHRQTKPLRRRSARGGLSVWDYGRRPEFSQHWHCWWRRFPRASGRRGHDDHSLVFPPQAHPYGVSFQEWAARYWQRTLSLPVDAASYAAPLSDGQSGEVWVLAGPLGSAPTGTVQFSIPEGKAMLISPITYWADNANCPTFTDFTVAELRAQVAASWSQVTETSCTIDGVTIPGLSNPQDSPYLFDSTVFSYTLA